MSRATERYRNLCLGESLRRINQYPIACKELSFILRGAYVKLPKNLQSLIFKDTLTAFRLLPEQAVLLRQLISCFRAHREEKESANLPHDVLVHIFGFLDLQSIISLALVCGSWNLAANDNHLWQLLYTQVFGNSDGCSGTKMQQGGRLVKEDYKFLKMNMVTRIHIDWKEAFRKAYLDTFLKTFISNRGYCGHCNTIVWHKNLKCSNRECELKCESQLLSIMDGYSSLMSSSDSYSESDEEPISRLWAYPRT